MQLITVCWSCSADRRVIKCFFFLLLPVGDPSEHVEVRGDATGGFIGTRAVHANSQRQLDSFSCHVEKVEAGGRTSAEDPRAKRPRALAVSGDSMFLTSLLEINRS